MNKSYDYFRVLSKEMRGIWQLAIIFILLEWIINLQFVASIYSLIWNLFAFIVFFVCFVKNYKIISKLNLEGKIGNELIKITRILTIIYIFEFIYNMLVSAMYSMAISPDIAIICYLLTNFAIEFFKYTKGCSSLRKISIWIFINFAVIAILASYSSNLFMIVTTVLIIFILPYLHRWVDKVCKYTYLQWFSVLLLILINIEATYYQYGILYSGFLLVLFIGFAFLLQKIVNIQQPYKINLIYPTLLIFVSENFLNENIGAITSVLYVLLFMVTVIYHERIVKI